MSTIIITLPSSGDNVPVELVRKKMKTCRLTVYPGERVRLAVPAGVSTKWAEAFLERQSGWIEKKLEQFRQTAGRAAEREIRDGQTIKLLGEELTLAVERCGRNHVDREGDIVRIGTRAPDDQERVKAVFGAWWRAQAQAIFEERVDQWYPVIARYGIERPRVAVRRMRTLWGSCSFHRKVVTFSLSLIQARVSYVDYVVLHELAHFLYPNHGKDFHDFLSDHMPDWRERKSGLNREVPPGS